MAVIKNAGMCNISSITFLRGKVVTDVKMCVIGTVEIWYEIRVFMSSFFFHSHKFTLNFFFIKE